MCEEQDSDFSSGFSSIKTCKLAVSVHGVVSDGLFMPEFAVYCEGGALISPFSFKK